MADPKGFIKHARDELKNRSVDQRTQDWKELPLSDSTERLQTQGSRCMDCGVPFCNGPTGCPVENLIPDWNDLVHRGRWREALKALHSTNNFPEFTGRLCPAPCETVCLAGRYSAPVTIRSIESAIVERGFAEGWILPVLPPRELKKSVGIIGSGPAGLAAAQQLRRAGVQITVYEKSEHLGGLLRFGIPDFKIEKHIVDRRIQQLRDEGVRFETGINIGVTHSAQELRKRHHALCLTIGAEQPRDLAVPGRSLQGVAFAMEYLTAQNRHLAHEAPIPSRLHAHQKHVVILGGGDTGADCLGTAIRQGAQSIHQLEIQPKPAHLKSSSSHEEGGNRLWGIKTTEFRGENGYVSELVAVTGDGARTELQADLVLLAMGFTGVVSSPLITDLKLQLTPRGTIQSDESYRTNIPGVFTAGDSKRGASLIVWAIAEGRKMAESVVQYLE